MGKSPNTCFKILGCGADSTQIDDDDPSPGSQNKQSSDKRKWSFRKRSARHQNVTVISEPQSVDIKKDSSQATPDNFHAVKDSSVPQKTPFIEKENEVIASTITNSETSSIILKTDEVVVPLPSAPIKSEIPPVLEHLKETSAVSSAGVSLEVTHGVDAGKNTFDDAKQLNETGPISSPVIYSEVTDEVTISKTTTSVEANVQEGDMAIVIQSAVRRFLAEQDLRKLRDVVKLQAVVRGYLVRKKAIGTLRSVQAIIKLQALVRARQAHRSQSLVKSTGKEKHGQKVKSNSDLKYDRTNSTVEKLLSNGFARLLLESTANTKTIHISCDPLKNDSTWQWLERWMAVTSSKEGNQQELNCENYQGAAEHSNSAHEELDVVPVSDASSLLSDPKFSPGNTEGEVVSDTHNSVKFDSQAPEIVSNQCLGFPTEGHKEQSLKEEDLSSKEENTVTDKAKEIFSITAQSALDSKTNSADFVNAFGSLEAEGKKIDTGSKKVRNPAFAAVQAKFEELSSAPKSNPRSINSAGQDAPVESKPNHSMTNSVKKNNNLSITENSNAIIHNPVIQVAASECGTEISISSTLDSPDRSEPDGGEIVLEIGDAEKINQNTINGANDTFNLDNMKAESRQPSTAPTEFLGQRIKDNNENIANVNSPGRKIKVERQPAEATTPGNSNQKENLQKTPKNHVTATESQGTPSSQASVQAKPSKTPNSGPPQKPKSTKSVSKSSPSNGKNDSGDRSSTEHHLPKDTKNAKRRSSFGMAKPDHVDNEPRHSSSNSLPSYMQATESARAKAHGGISLKSSPDAHEKENHTTKRHSFPIGDEKQGSSPRVQRSTSQSQQSSKVINTHSPHGSAERRWQR